MTYKIEKAAVIGSGTMGGGIAALLAGVGIPVLLLDLPAKDTQPGDPAKKRNALVLGNMKKMAKSRPATYFRADDAHLITAGNTEDDLEKLATVDWVIEVIIEKLDIKQNLMERLEAVVRPGTIVSSNTSGLSIEAIAAGRGDAFRQHFLGTHFFNPPRYLKLLEIIPQPDTDPELVDFMFDFGSNVLGKGCVVCKDTPNFIANRFISIVGSFGVNYAVEHGYTVEEVDAITGPLIGHPKTATFRLMDLVGVDINVYVAQNLYDAIPDDGFREVLRNKKADNVWQFLMGNKFLGRKSGQGFYKTVSQGGAKVHMPLNLETLEYDEPTKVRFESVGKHRKIADTGARIKAMISEDDRAGQYVWHLHAMLFSYASHKLGEIADTIVDIDNANRWGFAHEMGPFEIWNAVGVADVIPRMEADGYDVAPWVQQMLDSGRSTFYEHDDNGVVVGYYDPEKQAYVRYERPENVLILSDAKAYGNVVDRLEGASLVDLHDDVLLLEFHSKANAIDNDIMTMAEKALTLLEEDHFSGLVIGNDADHFSVGANLMLMVMAAHSEAWDQINDFIANGQQIMQRLRAAPWPVVTAPFGRVLGGGAEITMSGAQVVAHAETYMGLVEFGVGLIPAWTGTKELMRRVINPVMEASPNSDVLPVLQRVFETIATAKVAESAMQARELGFLRPEDQIVMNRDQLIFRAKQAVLNLQPTYQPLQPGKIWAAGRDAYTALKLGAWTLREGGWATDYDIFIAEKLAYILTGGALSEPQWVDEQYILDLEREAFMALAQQPKTLARIQHTLETGKPLRN